MSVLTKASLELEKILKDCLELVSKSEITQQDSTITKRMYVTVDGEREMKTRSNKAGAQLDFIGLLKGGLPSSATCSTREPLSALPEALQDLLMWRICTLGSFDRSSRQKWDC